MKEKETTHGGNVPRKGSLYWYPLNAIEELVLYPELFGQALLVRGRRDTDNWIVGYRYADTTNAWKAAEKWDGHSDPGHGWIRKLEGDDLEI